MKIIVAGTMDLFDFSAPISTTIIFDDSDDETFEKQPPKENFKIEEEESTNNSPKIEEVQDETEKPAENIIPTPTRYIPKTETCVLAKDGMQSTVSELLKSVSRKKQKKQAIQPKPLDMPLIEEENNNVGNDNSSIETRHKNEETDEKNNIRNTQIYTHISETQKQSETPIEKKKDSKRKLTEELSSSDKTETARKISAENRKSCLRGINLTDKNVMEKSSNELNPNHEDFETQKLDSSAVAVYSKYFTSCNETLSNYDEISQIESQKDTIETNKTHLMNIEINPLTQAFSQAQSNGNKSAQSLNKQQVVDNYLKILLNTVSQHMLYIFDSYQYYVELTKISTSTTLIQNAKNNYFNIRRHFFDLSYSTVVSIIIPKSNEPSFVKNFLTDTVEMGHSMSYNCSYEQIEAMYSDMITWVQKRQTQILNMNQIKKSSQMFAQDLQKPCSIPPITEQKDQVQKRSPRKKSTQARLPRKVINQSLYLHQPNQLREALLNVPQLPNSITQSKPLPPYLNQNQQYVAHLALNQCFQSHTFDHQSYIGPTYQNAYKQYYENQMPNSHPNQNTYLKTRQKQMKTNDNLQSMQNQKTNIEPSANYNRQVQGSTLQHNGSPWLNAINPKGQEHSPHASKNNIPPSHPNNFQQHGQETVSSQNYHQSMLVMPPEMTPQVEASRSSISRDSGFLSPLNFNTSNDLSVSSRNLF